MTSYASPPGDDLTRAFQEHVQRTGQPETFPSITTSRPPKDGAVVALFHPIRIPRGKRPLGDMAPCPICSPSSPKFLDRGTLIWCEGSLGIYAVGPECSDTLWADGRLNRAVNALRQTSKEKADLSLLTQALTSAPAQLQWIDGHRKAAELVARYHGNLGKAAPRLSNVLSRFARSSTSNELRGADFARGIWHLERKLAEAKSLWVNLDVELEDVDLTLLAPTAVQERLRVVTRAKRAMKYVADRLNIAADFLSRANAQSLAALGPSGRASASFKVEVTGTSVTIRGLGETWTAPTEIPGARSLP